MADVTISFITPARGDEKIVIELDTEMNKDASGSAKSIFRYGETAYFRAYASVPSRLRAVSSDGQTAEHGIGLSTKTGEFVSFITSIENETSLPIKDIVKAEWLGTALGRVTKSSAYTLTAEAPPQEDGREPKAALLEVSYTSEFKRFALTLPKKARDEYPVLIYVYSE